MSSAIRNTVKSTEHHEENGQRGCVWQNREHSWKERGTKAPGRPLRENAAEATVSQRRCEATVGPRRCRGRRPRAGGPARGPRTPPPGGRTPGLPGGHHLAGSARASSSAAVVQRRGEHHSTTRRSVSRVPVTSNSFRILG